MKKILFFIACGIVHVCMYAQSWNLTGNAGTTSKINFIGTKDNQALVIRTNNAERIRISSNGNIGIGVTNPMQKLNVKGNINIDSGFALYIANHRVLNIDSSYGNTFLGNGVAVVNKGKYNTVNGFLALHSNTTGAHNTANGYKTLYSNTLGYYDMAIGSFALYHNTTGNQNIAAGYEALYTNTTGNSNIAIGHFALSSNGTANFNTAVGEHALFSNTTGFSNMAIGAYTLQTSTGGGNTGIGYAALLKNTSGEENTAVGDGALNNNIDGWYNIAIGYSAGENNSDRNGWNNTFLGSGTKAQNDGTYNSTAIGNAVTVYASNQVRIGNDFVTSIGGPVNWTTISDGRVKEYERKCARPCFHQQIKPLVNETMN